MGYNDANGIQVYDGTGKCINGTKYWNNNLWSYTDNVTLYAQWTANNYTVTFNPNGGTAGSITSVTTIYDTANYYAHGGIVPTRDGYTFLGYYTAASGGSQVYDSNGYCVNNTGYWNNNLWVYTNNVTLYAQWKANKLGVLVNKQITGGDTWLWKNTTGRAVTLTTKVTSVCYECDEGYIFTYWDVSSNGSINNSATYGAHDETVSATITIPNGYYLALYAEGNVDWATIYVAEL